MYDPCTTPVWPLYDPCMTSATICNLSHFYDSFRWEIIYLDFEYVVDLSKITSTWRFGRLSVYGHDLWLEEKPVSGPLSWDRFVTQQVNRCVKVLMSSKKLFSWLQTEHAAASWVKLVLKDWLTVECQTALKADDSSINQPFWYFINNFCHYSSKSSKCSVVQAPQMWQLAVFLCFMWQ